MSHSINFYEFAPSAVEQQSVTIVFCLNQSQEMHHQYLAHFLTIIQSRKMICKALYTTPVSTEDCITFLEHTPCSFIICMDNSYLPFITQAHTKLFLAAPIICVDWGEPVAAPTPLPQKCFVVTTALPFFVEQMCSLIPQIPTIEKVCIVYCPQDLILKPLVPILETWLTARNYKTKVASRTASITGNDVIMFAQFDMVIFFCRNTPSDYLTRLATVCKEQRTILYAANPIATHYGVPCTFGPNIQSMAKQTIQMLFEYLSTNTATSPSMVEYQLIINSYEVENHPLLATGLASFIALAKKTTVITPTTADKVSAYLRLEQVPLE